MAKQAGPVFIEGTLEDLTFYVVDGIGYVRKKSSLTGKRVKKDPKFARTMQSAERLKRGSQLASNVYRSLPKEQQVYSQFKALKSLAIRAICEGKSEAETMALLNQFFGNSTPKEKRPKVKAVKMVVARSFKPLFRAIGHRADKKGVREKRGVRYQGQKHFTKGIARVRACFPLLNGQFRISYGIPTTIEGACKPPI